MIYTFSFGAIPPWLRERIEAQGLITVIGILQSFATAATNEGNSAAAAFFNNLIAAISSTPENSIAFGIGYGRIGVDFIG